MRKFLFVLGILVLLGGLTAGWLWMTWEGFLTGAVTPPGGEVALEVAPGTSLGALGRQLDAAGVIQDVTLPVAGSVFYLWAHKVQRAGKAIKAGEYLFAGPATPEQVLGKIVRGEVRTYKVTIPEGLRLEEIVPLFEAAGLAKGADLLALAKDPAVVRGLGIEADTLEGYLFPDTYTFAKGLSPRQLLAATVARFEDAWRRAEAGRSPDVKLDRHQAVTLASIVEKETGQPQERPRISCVFHNRLRRGMRLQTDPTVIYAKVLRGAWNGNITKEDLERPHPYNTYTIKGLPPGPIASPGAAALEAALDPQDCQDLFFVSRNDGSHVFCRDYDCHLREVEKWQVQYHRRKP